MFGLKVLPYGMVYLMLSSWTFYYWKEPYRLMQICCAAISVLGAIGVEYTARLIAWFVIEWCRSGNPDAVKIGMLLLPIGVLTWLIWHFITIIITKQEETTWQEYGSRNPS